MLPEQLLRFSVRDGRVVPHWFTAGDHPWLRTLLDEYERFVGRPRHELVERLREPLSRPCPPGKLRTAIHELDRLFPSERPAALSPRLARKYVFLTASSQVAPDREVALEQAASTLNVGVAEVEASLFADLPGERRVARPDTSVEPADLALRINSALAQGFIFRAARVRIEMEGAARAVVRHAKLNGLIGAVVPRGRAQDAVLELSGPFALFRRTLLYGRALAQIVPQLAWCERYRLIADVVLGGRSLSFQLQSGDPILPAAEGRRFDSKLEERFARSFAKVARDWEVIREPEPVSADGTLIFPDFALQHRRTPERRWLLEIVGFWTRDYLEKKLRRLRTAALENLILCIDEDRNVGESDLPALASVVPFRRKIDPVAVLRVLEQE